MFVFYDTETTGTNIAFDQILQFGAILTDSNFNELERIDIRCRLLPWVVPSPAALLVTNTKPHQLISPDLPDFYEMMETIFEKLSTWGQSIFIGFNSMKFDEPLLQRAFWQALKPPFHTVTNGNARFDILPFSRMLAQFRPETIAVPRTETGRASFKLDRLAPANGFTHHNAHDAMGDVEATIHLAKTFAREAPDLWSTLMSRCQKRQTNSVMTDREPVFIYESTRKKRATWYGLRSDTGRSSHATMLDLSFDWTRVQVDQLTEQRDAIIEEQAVSHIATNKAPIVLSLVEAETMLQESISSWESQQTEYLLSNPSLHKTIGETFAYNYEVDTQNKQLEELIFARFAGRSDEARMLEFWNAPADKRFDIAPLFQDTRYRHLAQRLLFVRDPKVLPQGLKDSMERQIEKRINTPKEEPHSWRSISDACFELESIKSSSAFLDREACVNEIENWLIDQLASES